MKNILVCPVAYNEHAKLENVIRRFLSSGMRFRADFLVVDDGSTDNTTDIICSFGGQGVETIRHPVRQGVGAAIRTAIGYARARNYDVIVIMAGNDKDNPDEIPLLVDPIIEGGFDIVQGSRYLRGERTGGDMPFYRRWATRLHPFLFSFFVRRRVTDSTNGFRAIRLSIFDDVRMNIDQDWLNAYELEPYILFQAIRCGYRFCEAAVTKVYPPKSLGYTKMKPVTGWWSILRPVFFLGLGLRK